MQVLPGFRDFYPEECALRSYVLSRWREVARRYGFVEYDGPVVEALALYEKKSGGELVGQMFTVGATADPGVVKGALRPEMTPTLARLIAARERDFKKPIKWFSLPNCFRHERQGRGRLREFYQLNCDIIGEASAAADAELIAVLIDSLRAFGLSEQHFVVRLSSRKAWQKLFTDVGGRPETEYEFFQHVDKAERLGPEKTAEALENLGVNAEAVQALRHSKDPSEDLAPVIADLQTRGLGDFVAIDYTIVRGLAYYTGVVFEVFDRGLNERALAGGGRYDQLLSLMSDGKADLPALGFGMGDVVLANLINDVPAAAAQRDAWLKAAKACDFYVIIAQEERRTDALRLVQRLRDTGHRVDFPLVPTKVGKQFQNAEQLGAIRAVVVGAEWPEVKVKVLATREETSMPSGDL